MKRLLVALGAALVVAGLLWDSRSGYRALPARRSVGLSTPFRPASRLRQATLHGSFFGHHHTRRCLGVRRSLHWS